MAHKCKAKWRREARAVKVIIAKLSWKRRDLVRRTGLKLSTVAHILSGDYPSWGARKRLNDKLGQQFFSPPIEGDLAGSLQTTRRQTIK